MFPFDHNSTFNMFVNTFCTLYNLLQKLPGTTKHVWVFKLGFLEISVIARITFITAFSGVLGLSVQSGLTQIYWCGVELMSYTELRQGPIFNKQISVFNKGFEVPAIIFSFSIWLYAWPRMERILQEHWLSHGACLVVCNWCSLVYMVEVIWNFASLFFSLNIFTSIKSTVLFSTCSRSQGAPYSPCFS